MASLIDGCCCSHATLVLNQPADSHQTMWTRRFDTNHAALASSMSFSSSNKNTLKKCNSAHLLSNEFAGFSLPPPPTAPTSIDEAISSVDRLAQLADMLKFNQIELEDVLISDKLGNGQFGDVFRAVYRRRAQSGNTSLVEVAIKKLKLDVDGGHGNELSADEKLAITQRFIREASKLPVTLIFKSR